LVIAHPVRPGAGGRIALDPEEKCRGHEDGLKRDANAFVEGIALLLNQRDKFREALNSASVGGRR
jgi:hypothetical protein